MTKRAILAQGLLWGDEGKGTIVDSLVRKYGASVVCRFSGGGNCGHNVMLDDGFHFCFSQFGSGHLVAGCKTYLGPKVIVNPVSLMEEERVLASKGITDNYPRLFIDSRALVTTPYHVAFNRMMEMSRGSAKHGSTGIGIWETVKDNMQNPDLSIRIGQLREQDLAVKLRALAVYKRARIAKIPINCIGEKNREEWESYNSLFYDEAALSDIFDQYREFGRLIGTISNTEQQEWLLSGVSIFEGNQGVGLDHEKGFHPYYTATSCTFENADALLKEIKFDGKVERVGILRTFSTRHGAGPLPSEGCKINEKNLSFMIGDDHNVPNSWQGNFRIGPLDLPLLEYTSQVLGKLDYLALTHCDKLTESQYFVGNYILHETGCADYKLLSPDTEVLSKVKILTGRIQGDGLKRILSNRLKTPILIESYGPAHKDKKYIEAV